MAPKLRNRHTRRQHEARDLAPRDFRHLRERIDRAGHDGAGIRHDAERALASSEVLLDLRDKIVDANFKMRVDGNFAHALAARPSIAAALSIE